MTREYRSRKHQIAAFAREARLDLDVAASRRFRKALRDAAMVGAAEERCRALRILRTAPTPSEAAKAIVAVGVLTVLGYTED